MKNKTAAECPGEPDVEQGLEMLVGLAKEEEEVGEIICRYTDAINTGEKVTRSDCLSLASSPVVAERAGRLINLIDLLMHLRRKRERS